MHPLTIPFKGLSGYFGYRTSIVPIQGRLDWDVLRFKKNEQDKLMGRIEAYYGAEFLQRRNIGAFCMNQAQQQILNIVTEAVGPSEVKEEDGTLVIEIKAGVR